MKRAPWKMWVLLGTLTWATAGTAQEWKPLFNGKDLTGWHTVGDGEWVVEDGAIVGKTQKAAKLYGLLVSDQTYSDFTVRLKFKSIQGNSGFYVRTVIEPPDLARGLQIEVDPQKDTGGIYESYGRGWVDKPEAAEVDRYFKRGEWNEMEIDVRGGTITVKVNGTVSAEVKNETTRPDGHLVMQMHAGNEMLVMFKDIEIKP